MPPITNTMETERRLEGMGFPPTQARGLAGLFEETATAVQLDLKGFIAAQFESLRSDLRLMGETLRAEMRDTEARLQREMRQQLVWFAAIQAAVSASLIALVTLILK
jgi:hypothetical protein